jgi:hypothetical protein
LNYSKLRNSNSKFTSRSKSLKLSLTTSLDSLLEQQDAGNWSVQKLEHKSPAFIPPESMHKLWFSSSTFDEAKPTTLLFFDTAAPALEPSTAAFRLQLLTQSSMVSLLSLSLSYQHYSFFLFLLVLLSWGGESGSERSERIFKGAVMDG